MKNIKFFKRIGLCMGLLLLSILFQNCSQKLSELFDPIAHMYKVNEASEHLFDNNWRFLKANLEGGESMNLDDAQWRTLDLPHDWSIEDVSDQADSVKVVGPFASNSPGAASTGHVLGGTAWYRKHFTLKKEDANKLVFIHFDGIYMNADVWINGHHLGNHPYGYTAFSYELTPYLNSANEENILAVEVKNEEKNSRWYSGSGIYRHVWLKVKEQVHFEEWAIAVTTESIHENKARVSIKGSINNTKNEEVETRIELNILDPEGKVVAYCEKKQPFAIQKEHNFHETMEVESPELWSLENPNLYILEASIFVGEELVDKVATTFGIRSLKFSTEAGFELNGENILLKGGCVHHDNGPLGAATYDRAEYRKVEILKANGFNAIRTSHNPPSRQFLDACDQLGMLVIDEAFDQWKRPKNPDDYNLYFDDWWKQDIQSMVLRDRNHPSIIMWSIGNEINERADSIGLVIGRNLTEAIKEMDTSRPSNAAICGFWDHPDKEWPDTEAAFEILDVAGYNYQWNQYESDHEQFPNRIIAGTESIAGNAFENWILVEKHPYVIGDFVWTAMDYLGESGIGHSRLDSDEEGPLRPWPWHNGYCGDIDLIGTKKPQSYYRDVVWNESKLEMAVHRPIPEGVKEIVSFWGWPDEERSWSWPGHEDKELQVNVYSSYDEVMLTLNDKLIDKKPMDMDMKLKVSFKVPYEPGNLIAYGLKKGEIVDSIIFQTVGAPEKLKISAERAIIKADRNDLVYVIVQVLDEQGIPIPEAEIPVRFTLDGPAELIAVASGNPGVMASFQKPECTTFRGRCLLIARPKGEAGLLKITAQADGLEGGEVKVELQEY